MLVSGVLCTCVDLMSQCIVVLKKILDQESKGWYIKYKDRLITELKGLNLLLSVCCCSFDIVFSLVPLTNCTYSHHVIIIVQCVFVVFLQVRI